MYHSEPLGDKGTCAVHIEALILLLGQYRFENNQNELNIPETSHARVAGFWLVGTCTHLKPCHRSSKKKQWPGEFAKMPLSLLRDAQKLNNICRCRNLTPLDLFCYIYTQGCVAGSSRVLLKFMTFVEYICSLQVRIQTPRLLMATKLRY